MNSNDLDNDTFLDNYFFYLQYDFYLRKFNWYALNLLTPLNTDELYSILDLKKWI